MEAAGRFAKGGCCGKPSKVRLDDIVALGLTPVPQTFDSSLGTIIPMLGWKELCVWVHEALVGPFPLDQLGRSEAGVDPGETVAAALRALAEKAGP